MGDRANIFVADTWASKNTEEMRGVYLYTHMGGYELPSDLADALSSPAGRGRWTDGAYLTRIIFCRMVVDDVKGETGFGISAGIGDNSYPILVVNPTEEMVYMVPEGQERRKDLTGFPHWSFEKFCTARPGWDAA